GAQFLGLGAGAAVADREIAAVELDRADRRQYRRGTAGKALSEPPACGILAPLAEGIGLLTHRDPRVLGQGDDRVAGDAVEDRVADRWRLHRAVAKDKENVHAAKFLDPAVLDGVEKHDLLAAVPVSLLLRQQAGGVVAAALRRPGAARAG